MADPALPVLDSFTLKLRAWDFSGLNVSSQKKAWVWISKCRKH